MVRGITAWEFNMMMRWCFFALIGLCVLGGALALYWPSFAGTRGAESLERLTGAPHFKPDPTHWQAFLTAVVDEKGNVDYEKASGPTREQLQLYLNQVAKATPSSFSPNERLAFYINAYNALVIDHVLRHWPIKSVDDAGPFHKFFRERVHMVAGTRVSLHGFESRVIRKYDPRLHFALNCASASCPPLSPLAYRAEELDAQLEAAAKRFINDSGRNLYDEMTQTWYLSQIFDWYADDFGGDTGIRALLNKHLNQETPEKAQIIFLEYDWALNSKVIEAQLHLNN